MILDKDFKEFVELLIHHNVDYLVVGGYAVGIHGYPRFTGDLDIWLRISEENAEKIMQVIADFGLASLSITKTDFLTPDKIVQIGYPPFRIDILTNIDGVKFEDAFLNKIVLKINDLDIYFIGYDDLIKNKKASGRNRDIDDVDNLQKK